MGVKTTEEARALPEVESELFETYGEIQEDGTAIKKDRLRSFVPDGGIEGDDIIIFWDPTVIKGIKCYRSMKVIETENGPAKTRLNLL